MASGSSAEVSTPVPQRTGVIFLGSSSRLPGHLLPFFFLPDCGGGTGLLGAGGAGSASRSALALLLSRDSSTLPAPWLPLTVSCACHASQPGWCTFRVNPGQDSG